MISSWPKDHPIQPDPTFGAYRAADGATLVPAHRLIDQAYPPLRNRPQRDQVLREGVASYARARFRNKREWQPVSSRYDACRPMLEVICGHGFWDRLSVLRAPCHLADRRRAIATTADLLVQFESDGTLGLAMLQTAQPELLRPEAVLAELGAAAAMVIDRHLEPLSLLFTLWAVEGHLRIERVEVDQALAAWVDGLQLAEWLANSRRSA